MHGEHNWSHEAIAVPLHASSGLSWRARMALVHRYASGNVNVKTSSELFLAYACYLPVCV